MSLRDSLEQDAVQALRIHEPVTLGPRGTVGEAVALMQERASGCVFVTEEDRPVGIVTERDILTKVLARRLPADTPVSGVMTCPPEVIHEGCPVIEVIRRMDSGGFRHMPVVSKSDKLQGVVSVKRVVQYLVEYFPAVVFNVPPESVERRPTREGA